MGKRLTKNLGLKILALLAAMMLWFIVVNADDPETTQSYHDIPVSVVNEEVLAETNQTYQIVDGTQTVSVTVRANRSVLNSIKDEDIVATADMKELSLNTQIPIEVTISGYEGDYKDAYTTPRNLQVSLEEELTKKFPIVPTTTGTVRDGYALGEITANPEKVSIRGPISVIDRISRVEAEVSVSGLSSDTELPSQLVLYDDENNEIDQSLLANNLGTEGVTVRVQLLDTKSVPLVFDTSQVEAAEGYSVAGFTYEPEDVLVSGVKAELEAVSQIDVPASALTLTGLDEKTEKIVDITDYLPETVALVDANAGSVVVTISVEKDGTRSYDVSLGNITVNGLDEDLALDYGTSDVLEVQLRGPKAALEKFETADKNVSIDLSGYKEPGNYNVPVKVIVPDGCTLEKELEVNVILKKK